MHCSFIPRDRAARSSSAFPKDKGRKERPGNLALRRACLQQLMAAHPDPVMYMCSVVVANPNSGYIQLLLCSELSQYCIIIVTCILTVCSVIYCLVLPLHGMQLLSPFSLFLNI